MPDFDKLTQKLYDVEKLQSYGFINGDICKRMVMNILINMKGVFDTLSTTQQNNVIQAYNQLL
jgi:hypothetical protein